MTRHYNDRFDEVYTNDPDEQRAIEFDDRFDEQRAIEAEVNRRSLTTGDATYRGPVKQANPNYQQQEGPGLKPSNPKDMIGSDKIPFHLWPETATILGSLALLDGALKYGRGNWRVAGVRFTIYYDALRRHMNKWLEGEKKDPDSGLPHFAHVLACAAILADAEASGTLTDDSNFPGGYVTAVDELTPHVKRLKEVHKDKHPHHYTRADAKDGK